MLATKHLVVALLLLCKILIAQSSSKLPKISLDQLKNGDLEQAKTQYGDTLEAMIVTGLPEEYQTALDRLIADAPDCLVGSHKHHKHMQHLPMTHMPDGSFRTTYATEEAQFPSCLSMMASLTDAFDQVEQGVVNLAQKAHGGDKDLGYMTGNGKGVTLLQDAPVKDHVHVYQKSQDVNDDAELMVPYHTDNGLFLILTPFPDTGLLIRLGDGTEIQTSDEVEPRSVLVLMGRGMTQWLLQKGGYPESETKFQPGEHAVPSLSGSVTQRSVYARMKVAPGDAIPASLVQKEGSHRVKDLKTFNEVFKETVSLPEHSSVGDKGLCSVDLQGHYSHDVSHSTNGQWFRAMDDLCKEGTAYCWMSCMPVPDKCQGHPDQMKCFNDKNNVTCRTNSHGKVMDPGCEWHCMGKPDRSNDFCNGAMDMLMSGFEAAGVDNSNPCIILFIKAWTLDSRLKFSFACIGVMLLGILVEFNIFVRRKLTTRRRISAYLRATTPSIRRLASIFLFGFNLFLGYLAMLVAMTYSIELFMCVILGLMIGHAAFNMRQPVGETIDPCCAPSQDQAPLTIENGVFGHADVDSNTLSPSAPQGPVTRTPCDGGPCSQPTTAVLLNPPGSPGDPDGASDNGLVASTSTCHTNVGCEKAGEKL